ALLAFHPDAVGVEIGQETPTRPVVRVRHVVPGKRSLAGDLADSRHDCKSSEYRRPGRTLASRALCRCPGSGARLGNTGTLLKIGKIGKTGKLGSETHFGRNASLTPISPIFSHRRPRSAKETQAESPTTR